MGNESKKTSAATESVQSGSNGEGSSGLSNNIGVINILQIGAVLLATVSFWATAQGMKDFVFPKPWQAYAASLAIQGILLGMNFALPSFLKKAQLFIRICLVVLTCIALFCSSWFSYIFIAQKAYEQSWDSECLLLVQETYQKELFDSEQYARENRRELATGISEEINSLYKLANKLNTNSQTEQLEYDFQADLSSFANNNIVGSDIKMIIPQMVNLFDGNASREDREALAVLLDATQTKFQDRLTRNQARQENMSARIEELQQQILSERRARTDEDRNVELINQLTQDQADINQDLNKIDSENAEIQAALDKLKDYQILLSTVENGMQIQVTVILQNIQKELVAESSNSADTSKKMADLFDLLQKSSNLFDSSDITYSELLSKVTNLTFEINDYVRFYSNETQLRELVDSLSNKTDTKNELSKIEAEKNDEETTVTETETETDISDSTVSVSSNQRTDANEKDDAKQKTAELLPKWVDKTETLKGIITSLPERDNGLSYSKASSLNRLNEVIRRYATEHNDAHQGLIYLFSPYWPMALFSLILALFFDLSGFVVGVVIYKFKEDNDDNKINKDNNDKQSNNETGSIPAVPFAMLNPGGASMTKTLRQYYMFTGDYEKIGTDYYYKAFLNGKEEEIEGKTGEAYGEAIYLKQNENSFELVKNEQFLTFDINPDSSEDGVVCNKTLYYENNLLLASDSKKKDEVLAQVDESTPVFILQDDYIHACPIKRMELLEVKTGVLALSLQGNSVAAVYLIHA